MNNTTTQQEKSTRTQIRTGGVAGKIILLSIVLAAIFIGISFGYAVWSTRTVVLNDAIEAQETGVIFDAQKLEFLTEDVQGTLRSLHGTPPLQGLIRASENDGIDEVGLSTEQQWKERLQTIFVSEMNAARIYDQLRFIDETGQEIVRVDDVEGEIFVVSEEKLQNKANRDYFKEASTLLEGQIYASKAELNREGIPPVVSVPYRPVIRYAIAIFDERDNSFEGVLMANVRVNSLLELSGLQSDERSDVYVIDSLGHFILHPDPS
ncbi:MAG: cache domain-containing protein, partial [Candidatus Andersenbacteria bacterium]|nr:cache domain-containing protein [Candidatus Andersenbacteria bacterium]